MKKFFLALGAGILTLLQVGCYQQITQSANEEIRRTEVAINQANHRPVQMIQQAHDERHHPAWLQKNVSIHARGARFDFLAEKLISGMPAIVAFEPDVSRGLRYDMSYQGPLEGALEILRARSSYSYSIDGSVITWTKMQTKSFDVSFMPGVSSYMLGKREGTSQVSLEEGGVSDINAHQFTNLQGTLSVWHDLEKTLHQLKSPQGQVTVSEATTTVTVHDYASRVRIIEEYLDHLNRSLSREVALQVQVLDIEMNRGFNTGINWNLVRQYMDVKYAVTANVAQPVRLESLGSNLNAGIGGFIIRAESGPWNQTDMLINAISQQGKVSTVTQPRVVTLNNQVAEIDINTQTGYLREISTSTFGRDNNPIESVTPGKVKTGFTLYLLPKIQDRNVFLQISSTLSMLRSINSIKARPDSRSSGQIEVPTVVEKRFNQRALVPSESTLVLAGFKQLSNTVNQERVFESPLLGGRGAKQNNTETIVLITPIILNAG